MFFDGVEVFYCIGATALMTGKLLFKKIISNWKIPSELHNDLGTPFTGQIIQSFHNVWPILQHYYCAYHPRPLDWWNIPMVQAELN